MNFLNLVIAEHALRNERNFRDRLDPLDCSERELFERYRFPRQVLLELISLLRRQLQRPTRRSQALPAELQICIALRFYATGSFLRVLGDAHGCSSATVSTVLEDVSQLLRDMAPAHIVFPRNQQDRHATARSFFDIARLPQVLGAIDCTHIRIRRPVRDDDIFVNRKGFHSINVQAVCDASLKFTNIVARWPGSSHDSFIFQQSGLHELLAEGVVPGFLVGDSGYPLRPYLLTPFKNPGNNAEQNFNRRLSRTRVTIERAFGVLKLRFRCLDQSGGSLQFEPNKVCTIITACCVLHNFAISRRAPLPPDVVVVTDDEGAIVDCIVEDNMDGRTERLRIMKLLPM